MAKNTRPKYARKKCPLCGIILKEVRKVYDPQRAENLNKTGHRFSGGDYFFDYPKEIFEPGVKGRYYEYRFVCKKCKRELIYDNLNRMFDRVPKNSQYRWSWVRKALVLRKKAKISL